MLAYAAKELATNWKVHLKRHGTRLLKKWRKNQILALKLPADKLAPGGGVRQDVLINEWIRKNQDDPLCETFNRLTELLTEIHTPKSNLRTTATSRSSSSTHTSRFSMLLLFFLKISRDTDLLKLDDKRSRHVKLSRISCFPHSRFGASSIKLDKVFFQEYFRVTYGKQNKPEVTFLRP